MRHVLASTLHQQAIAELDGPNWLDGRYHSIMHDDARASAAGLKGALDRGSHDDIQSAARLLLDCLHQARLMGAWRGALDRAVRNTLNKAAHAYGYRAAVIN